MDAASTSDDWSLPVLAGSSLRVFARLGHGAFARCWLAEYNGQQVALKVMNPRPKLPATFPPACPPPAAVIVPPEEPVEPYERMFFREAQVMSQIRHRHIVRCLGFMELPVGFVPDETQPALAMVLELCKPYTLKDLITKGMAAGRRTYKVKQAYGWLHQVASALAHLHSQKPPIIHRDIKPENILLQRDTDSGELICKVADLGLHVSVSEDRSVMLRRKSTRRDVSLRAGGAGSGGSGAVSFADRSAPGCRRETPVAAIGRCTEGQRAGLGSRGTSAGGAGCGLEESPFYTFSTGPSYSTGSCRSSGQREMHPAAARLRPDGGRDEQPQALDDPWLAVSVAARMCRISGSHGSLDRTGHLPDLKQLEQQRQLEQEQEQRQQQQQQQQQPLQVPLERQDSLDMMVLPLPPLLMPAGSPTQQQVQRQEQQRQQERPNITACATDTDGWFAGKVEIQNNDCPEDAGLGDALANGRASHHGDSLAGGGQRKLLSTFGARHQDDGGTISATSPGSPDSVTISTLLCRHPDLVEAVPHHNPASGLRPVGSLLRQLGKAELQPLRRHEMEWVYGLTGQAGSFMYMAPEVFLQEPYNEKSDVFSFGVLAYEVLASELVIISMFNTGRGKTLGVSDPRDYAELVAKADYRPPRVRALSDSAWALIEACWHPDPVQRPTMAAVEARLAQLAAELGQTGDVAAATAQQQQQLQQQKPQQPRHQTAVVGDRAPRVLVGAAAPRFCGPCIIC